MPLYRGSRRLVLVRKPTTALAPAVLTFVGIKAFKDAGGGTTTFTFNTVNLGTSTANRRVIIATLNNPATTGTIVSGTVAGVSMDVVQNNGTDGNLIAFMSANIGTTGGSSGTVVMNFTNNNSTSCGFALYTIDNTTLSSPTPVTGYATGTGTTNTITTTAIAGGCEIALLQGGLNTFGSTPTITASTETFTADQSSTTAQASHANGIASNASSSVTYTWTGSTGHAIALAAWR